MNFWGYGHGIEIFQYKQVYWAVTATPVFTAFFPI